MESESTPIPRGHLSPEGDPLVGWLVLVWFGLVGFSFNASLEPQPRARRRARLAEDGWLIVTSWRS
jgi:hypothetical protein